MSNSEKARPGTKGAPRRAAKRTERPRSDLPCSGLKLAVMMGALLFSAAACGSAAADSDTAAVGDVVPIQSSGDETEQTAADQSGEVAGDEPASTDETPLADDPVGDPADGSGAGADTNGAATIEDAQAAYREFTDCMRNEGIQMPPAVFDAEGKIDLDAQLAYFQSLDPNEAASQDFTDEAAAEEQCAPANANELLALISPDASDIEQLQTDLSGELDTQLTALAQCMRAQFPDFPDPVGIELDLTADDDQGFNPFPGIDDEDPLYAAPMETCAQSVGLGGIGG